MRNVQSRSGMSRRGRGLVAAFAGAAMLVALASCGGGHDDGNNPPPAPQPASNTPPASASASVQEFIDYLKILVATMQDTVEPLDVNAFVAPVSDTADPDPGV
ncbi:MAG: hypothetical protein ACR2GP_06710 [Burkholderiaceae bacterium]